MTKTSSIFIASSLCGLLAACGGGSGGGSSTPTNGSTTGGSTSGGSTTPTTPPQYETLNSTAAKTSTIGGVAVRSSNGSSTLETVKLSGSTTHNTGDTTLSDGTYTLRDRDGFNGTDTLTDGTSTITAHRTAIKGSYEYATGFSQSYRSGGRSYDVEGLGGVVTNAADMPKSGTATYTGGALAVVVANSSAYDLENGSSSVTANFGSNTVNVTLNGFTAKDQVTGAATTAPIDTISATGMRISGNGFEGGTVQTTNGGTAVNITGSGTTSSAQGNFFGYDASASAPDEVGGIIRQQGNDGLVRAIFIAD